MVQHDWNDEHCSKCAEYFEECKCVYPKGPYQGWANAQTWAVALCWDNEKVLQDSVIRIVRGFESGYLKTYRLKDFAMQTCGKIYDTAPWAWKDKQSICDFVDWFSILKHYETKIKEDV